MDSDFKSTGEVIRQAAALFRQRADALEKCAEKLETKKEWAYVSEAVGVVSNTFSNLRLDLFVARPIRTLEREIYTLEDNQK